MGKTTYPPAEIGSTTIGGDIKILGDLTVQGQTSRVDNILTTKVSIQDSNNNEQIGIYGDTSNNRIDMHGNKIVDLTNSNALSLIDNPGAATLLNASVTSSASSGTEESYSFDINGNNILKLYSESNGSGGIQNSRIQLFSPLNTQSNPININSDGTHLNYGASEDMSSRYDSSTDSLRWRNNTGSADIMELTRSAGALNITGQITEGASL